MTILETLNMASICMHFKFEEEHLGWKTYWFVDVPKMCHENGTIVWGTHSKVIMNFISRNFFSF